MAAAVVRMLKARGLLNNPIKVISQNGAPYGIELIKRVVFSTQFQLLQAGRALFLFWHFMPILRKITEKNQQILCPIPHYT